MKRWNRELFDFIGDVCGISGEDISDMEIMGLVGLFKNIAEANDLVNFFKSAFSSYPLKSVTSSSNDTEE